MIIDHVKAINFPVPVGLHNHLFEREFPLPHSELIDFFNFSFYNNLITNQPVWSNFTESFLTLKTYVAVNSNREEPPIFFYQTIFNVLDSLNKLIDQCDRFFSEKENLLTLGHLLEFNLILYEILNRNIQINQSTRNPDIEKCHEQIKTTFRLLRDYNDQYNQFNKEIINFYVMLSVRITGPSERGQTDKDNTQHVNDIIGDPTNEIKFITTENNSDTNGKSNPFFTQTALLNKNNWIANKKIENKINIEQQLIKSSSQFDKISSNLSFPDSNKLSSSTKLKARTKKYAQSHFQREPFKKFLSCLGIKEPIIHQTLERVALQNYEDKSRKYKAIFDYLDFTELKKVFNSHFTNHSLYLIGSCRSGVLYDIKNRPIGIDLLLLPNIYDGNYNKREGLMSFIKTFGNVEGILKILGKINSELNQRRSHFLLLDLENIKEEHLENFYCSFDLKNKNFPDRPTLNVNLIFYDERLKLSSDLIGKYFYKNQQLQSLHMFFQEILISKLNLISRRRDLSNLILAFLDQHYNLFIRNRTHMNCYFLQFKDSMLKQKNLDFKNAALCEDYTFTFVYEFNSQAMADLKGVGLGELILEFLRYVINYLEYIKNDYNRRNNKNFLHCKGFEYLAELYEHNMSETDHQYYVLDHEFFKEFYKLPKLKYDMEFCKKVDFLEEIYFKICENADRIVSYSQILENVSELQPTK